MTFLVQPRPATLAELRIFFGVTTYEIVQFVESLTTEERWALKNDPDIPRLDYWDVLDAEERKFKDG